jgi:hypothetical protein
MPRLGPPSIRPPRIESNQAENSDTKSPRSFDRNGNRRKAFALHIFASPEYKHKTIIRESPLHGPWATHAGVEETFQYSALRKSLDNTFDAPGLCDWQSAGQAIDEWGDATDFATPGDEVKDRLTARRRARAEATAKEKFESERILGLLRRVHQANTAVKQ